jgi:hypothetical protein
MKEWYSMQTTEYVVNNDVDRKPAFNWWVSHALKRRNQIISKVKLCQKQFINTNEKFGIKVPWNVEKAYEFDRINGNTLLADAITKGMKNSWVAFNTLSNGERVPNNYQYIHCHMIFNIKMESFCRKARLVASGNSTEEPKYMTYSSVVSR